MRNSPGYSDNGIKIKWSHPRYFSLLLVDAIFGAIISIFAIFKGFFSQRAYEATRSWGLKEPMSYEQYAAAFPRLILSNFQSPEFLKLLIPAVLSTLTLTPFLIRHLERERVKQPAARYFMRSAFAGVLFGLAACPLTGFFLGVVSLTWRAPGVDQLEWTRLLAAPFYMMIMGAITFPILFFKQILAGGLLFGVLNAAWLKIGRTA